MLLFCSISFGSASYVAGNVKNMLQLPSTSTQSNSTSNTSKEDFDMSAQSKDKSSHKKDSPMHGLAREMSGSCLTRDLSGVNVMDMVLEDLKQDSQMIVEDLPISDAEYFPHMAPVGATFSSVPNEEGTPTHRDSPAFRSRDGSPPQRSPSFM